MSVRFARPDSECFRPHPPAALRPHRPSLRAVQHSDPHPRSTVSALNSDKVQDVKNGMPFVAEQFLVVPKDTSALSNGNIQEQQRLPLQTAWALWMHYNDNTSWTIDSYLNTCSFSTVQGFWLVFNMLKLDQGYNYFLMRTGILPVWEDARNVTGGAFSLQVENARGSDLWLDVCMFAIGSTLFTDDDQMTNVNGISVGFNRGVCTVKIWHKCRDQLDSSLPDFFQQKYQNKVRFINHRIYGAVRRPVTPPLMVASNTSDKKNVV